MRRAGCRFAQDVVPTLLHSLFTAYRHHRFAMLFFSIVLTIVGNPLLDVVGIELDLLEAFLALNLLSAILSGLAQGYWRALAATSALVLVARAIAAAFGHPAVLSASEATWAAAGFIACVATLRFVLREGVVNSERIYAALSVYLLAAIVFGVIYHLMESLHPGSLRATSVAGEPVIALSLETSIYFSLVTLATLGYGDIVPAVPLARAVATLEAVGAQLYLAVLIARLVGLQGHPTSGGRPR